MSLMVYTLLAVLFGEVWPLSRFTMYAHLPTDAVVPVLRVNGQAHYPEELVDFHGCSSSAIRIPSGVRCRVGWRQDEIARWVSSHSASQPGDVRVQFGYQWLRASEQGPRLDAEFIELCAGSARWGQ